MTPAEVDALLAVADNVYAKQTQVAKTHWDGCEAAHENCAIRKLAAALRKCQKDAARLDWVLAYASTIYLSRPIHMTLPEHSRSKIDEYMEKTK